MTVTIREGIVSTVNHQKATARVYFEDMDDTVSAELKVTMRNTRNTKDYWMPEVEQAVVCLMDGEDYEKGYILASVYSEVDTVPGEFLTSEDVDGIKFPDGSVITYDSINHKLIVDINGEIEFRSKTSPIFTTKG